jgi:hypothetical protein
VDENFETNANPDVLELRELELQDLGSADLNMKLITRKDSA